MAPTKTALRTNLAKGRAVLSDKKNIMGLDLSIESLKNQLHDALNRIKELEADVDEKNQALAKFSKQVQRLKDSKFQLQNDVKSWKAKHESVYHKYCMASQSTRRGVKKQDDLETQIKFLEGVAKCNRTLLVNSTRDFQQAITVLKTTNQNLQSQLSHSLTKWTENINSLKQDLNKKARALRETRKNFTKLTKQSSQAAVTHTRNVAAVKAKVTSQMSKHHLMKKGVFTEETWNVVRLLVKAGCSAQYINEVLASVLHSAGIQLVDSISRTSVARIVQEGFIAAQIQLGHEMHTTQGMTFSADGTGHRSINYNSQHVHLRVEDYSLVDSDGLEPQPGTKRATRFLGIMPSLDNSSEEAISDWHSSLVNILDLYNRSPFAKRTGGASLFRLIDILIKLAGMNTDHCAKEKKDAEKFKELKEKAIYEHLGEESLLDRSISEVNALYAEAEKEMIEASGGQHKWNRLSADAQAAKCVIMLESVVADLGKEAYSLLSEKEQCTLWLFIWVGCGCHKDLNTVRSGYRAMSQWWDDNGFNSPGENRPVQLCNRENRLVLDERDEALMNGDETTPAQDAAFSRTSGGAVKAAELAGALFNHKDDKKGHHDLFRWWYRVHVRTPFTFPDTSNNRFQSYCDAAASLLLHTNKFIQFLEHVRDNKQNGTLNNMEQNLWDALHCQFTKSEMAVLVLYAEAVSYPYMRAIRAPGDTQNMLDLGPLHAKVDQHIKNIIANPDLILGPVVNYTTATLNGEKWVNPDVVQHIQEISSSLPSLRELLHAFFQASLGTWARFTSEFAPGGLIDKATAEEKDLAYMPATNDENEGALGSFRRLMGRQPQLSLLTHNSITMFFRNDTAGFIKAKLTEEEDHKFLRTAARELKGQERKRQEELVKFQDQKQAEKAARRAKRKAAAEEAAARLSNTPLILTFRKAKLLKGTALQDQVKLFKNLGAPNLVGQALPTKADDKRSALRRAIRMYKARLWIIGEDETALDQSDPEADDDSDEGSDVVDD